MGGWATNSSLNAYDCSGCFLGFSLCLGCWPGLAPAGDLLSFASPKESRQRKGDPAVCVPPLRYGQPAVLGESGGPQNSLRSNSCGPDPAFSCAPRHSQRGLGSTRRGASLCGLQECFRCGSSFKAERSEGSSGICGRAQRRPEPPLWLRRGAQRFADKGSQLFERSAAERVLRDPAKREHRRLPAASLRVADSGSPFLWLLSFGEAKESDSPAGARPGQQPQPKTHTQKIRAYDSDPLQQTQAPPTPLPQQTPPP
jgi:hypothetical protein